MQWNPRYKTGCMKLVDIPWFGPNWFWSHKCTLQTIILYPCSRLWYIIVLVYTDDLLCFYHDSSTFHHLLYHMYKFFPCTSQEVPVLEFINFHIVQYKHGISFYHTSHIKKTIVDVWFSNPIDLLGVCNTPFQKWTTYEQELAETLPIPRKDLHGVKNKYGGLIFNAQIGKYLHVEEWSCTDIVYMKMISLFTLLLLTFLR